MINFYSGIISICILSLISIAIDAGKNTILSSTDIRWFRACFILVAVGALNEWAGIIFNEVITVPNWIHYLVTILEYSITPFLAILITRSCGFKRYFPQLLIFMGIHVLIEVIASFFGWIFYIDEVGKFVAGPAYNIYMIFCFLSFAYAIVILSILGKRMGLNNSISLILIIGIIIIGQISCINDGIIFSGYISVSIGSILMYNYFQIFMRHQMLSTITMEHDLANNDPLTGVSSRICYERKTFDINLDIKNKPNEIQFAIAEVDLNNLKYINDGFGHDFGDEYIRKCCKFVCNFFKHSQIFRVGGDEFIVLVQDEDLYNLDSIIKQLRNFTICEAQKEIDFSERTSFAIGYSIFNPNKDKSVSQVFKRADQDMYTNKKEVKSILYSH